MTHKTDVLVIGAGPTGLMLACELRRHGLKPRIVDKAAQPTQLSKAIVVHARTLEAMQTMGLAQNMIDHGLKLDGVRMYSGGKVLVRAGFDELDTNYPFAFACPNQKQKPCWPSSFNPWVARWNAPWRLLR